MNQIIPFVCLKGEVRCYKVLGWGPGASGVRRGGTGGKASGCSGWALSSERTEGAAPQPSGGAVHRLFSPLHKHPQAKFSELLFSSIYLARAFLGKQGAGLWRVIIWEQPGISSEALENWGGDTGRFFFLLWTGEEGSWWISSLWKEEHRCERFVTVC